MTNPPRRRAIALAGAGVVVLVAAVYAIYLPVTRSYFYNDDFQWLQGGRQFDPAELLNLDRYVHFYRPVVEIYFALGSRLFGCQAQPFHLLSIGIHLLNALVLYLFASALTGRRWFAGLAALLFAMQPGYAEAVAWVGAIAEVLQALWFLLTLWLYLRFIQSKNVAFYALSIVTFAACLFTHESSATLLPMMVALEIAVVWKRGAPDAPMSRWRRCVRYVPFALLLLGFLVIAYTVNSRSYIVREGHYQLGWHAVSNVLRYIVSLYVGKQRLTSYAVIAVTGVALLVAGNNRMRLFVLWIVIALAPASLFTWGNVSRYLYLSGAGFALLLAELLVQCEDLARRRWSLRSARALVSVVAVAITIRFAVFTIGAARDFRERTRPSERFVAALIRTNPAPQPGGTVYISRDDAKGLPDQYRDAAAEAAFCTADVRVEVR